MNHVKDIFYVFYPSEAELPQEADVRDPWNRHVIPRSYLTSGAIELVYSGYPNVKAHRDKQKHASLSTNPSYICIVGNI